VVVCLERGADLHMTQLMPLPLTVSCFSKIQTGFTFLVPSHPGSPGQRAVRRGCVCVCRSGEEQLEVAANTGHHQSSSVKVAAEIGIQLPTGGSTVTPHDTLTPRDTVTPLEDAAANHDLGRQLQSAVRSEMRRIMEVEPPQFACVE